MSSYTITIAPNDDSGAGTRLVVDTSGDQVRITDVHLHAPQGLSSGHIPAVDVELLLQAVTGAVTASSDRGGIGATELAAPAAALEAATAAEASGQRTAPAAAKGRSRKGSPRGAAPAAPRRARARTATAAAKDGAITPRREAQTAPTTTTRTAKHATAKATRTAAAAKTTPAPAKKRTTTRGPAPAVASPHDNRDRNQAIREWAGKNGYQVSGRGRIPAAVVEAFHATR